MRKNVVINLHVKMHVIQNVSINFTHFSQGAKHMKNGRLTSQADLLVQKLEQMHSLKQIQDKELLAAKRKLELHHNKNMASGSGGNSPFIVSPYACPVAAENDKRSLKTRRKQHKRCVIYHQRGEHS